MWNPPLALTPEEHKIAARTRKARKFSHSIAFRGKGYHRSAKAS